MVDTGALTVMMVMVMTRRRGLELQEAQEQEQEEEQQVEHQQVEHQVQEAPQVDHFLMSLSSPLSHPRPLPKHSLPSLPPPPSPQRLATVSRWMRTNLPTQRRWPLRRVSVRLSRRRIRGWCIKT